MSGKTRKKKKTKSPDIIKKLFQKADEVKKTGAELTKIAAEQAQIHGKKLSKEGKKRFDESIVSAKKTISSSEDSLKLLERLGKLRKEGVISEKDFREKKKKLLERI